MGRVGPQVLITDERMHGLLPRVHALRSLTRSPVGSGRPRGVSPALQEPTDYWAERLQGLGWDLKVREGMRSKEALGKEGAGGVGGGGAATTTSRLPLPHWLLSRPGWTQWDLVVGDKVGLYPGHTRSEAEVSRKEEAVRGDPVKKVHR